MSEYTRTDLVEAAQRASRRQENPLSRSDFERISGISQYHIYRLFPDGGWRELQREAGIEEHPNHHVRMEDHQILSEFHMVVFQLGRIPTWAQFNSHASISADVLRKRFGSRTAVLERYVDWLQQNEPESPLLSELDELNQPNAPPKDRTETVGTEATTVWDKGGGTQFGSPIDFRGLRHAPINEQGVVFLFGMVSRELGFLVEAVHASFPDCEAKRLVDQRNDRWERVRIEFEFKSRNFKEHGHDPMQCDLVVCWEHNWPECPLEVIELRQVIDNI